MGEGVYPLRSACTGAMQEKAGHGARRRTQVSRPTRRAQADESDCEVTLLLQWSARLLQLETSCRRSSSAEAEERSSIGSDVLKARVDCHRVTVLREHNGAGVLGGVVGIAKRVDSIRVTMV